jgi:RNA polymerase sigma-70 factor, ECF subfamily
LSPTLSNATKLDDATRVKQIQAGDRRAFSELVSRHQTIVYRSCYRILGHHEDAKDATQETFLSAYKKLDTFRGRSTFKTWLVRGAMNVSLNERTSKRKVAHSISSCLAPQQYVASTEEAPEAELMRTEAAGRMHDALELVRADHRAAIVLREFEGLTYQETAESLGITEGTAKSWVHRGRKQLKRILIAA